MFIIYSAASNPFDIPHRRINKLRRSPRGVLRNLPWVSFSKPDNINNFPFAQLYRLQYCTESFTLYTYIRVIHERLSTQPFLQRRLCLVFIWRVAATDRLWPRIWRTGESFRWIRYGYNVVTVEQSGVIRIRECFLSVIQVFFHFLFIQNFIYPASFLQITTNIYAKIKKDGTWDNWRIK